MVTACVGMMVTACVGVLLTAGVRVLLDVSRVRRSRAADPSRHAIERDRRQAVRARTLVLVVEATIPGRLTGRLMLLSRVRLMMLGRIRLVMLARIGLVMIA